MPGDEHGAGPPLCYSEPVKSVAWTVSPWPPRLAPAGTQLSSLLRWVEGGSMSLASPALVGELERPRLLFT